ncbi:hypothetical protein DF141_29220 [Burkholderia cenocepacia]|nr:hypothetical protein AS149_33025 [Burkholderia cenocepacia]OXI69074.1 hypothetical protein CFB44_29670 [Burkholderia sp. AU31280]RQU67546.1 hypothetical protein DF141_29220 [Burkholderia cenocepacia]RQU83727.1 hypothetical protein DF133_30120 [Burkholderia cenocepacia]RQV14101.1 hypothetical protein DF132_31685 [Burkholderia cenocepacia]
MPGRATALSLSVPALRGHARNACCIARWVSYGSAASSAKTHARASTRPGNHADAPYVSPLNRNRAVTR